MGERILIVEDDHSMRQFLAILLKRDGYDVESASGVRVALRSLDKRWPDLILTDLNMPGESGMDLLRLVKERSAKEGRDVEVVVVTAYGTTETAVDAMKEGAADYVLKPFDNDELRMVVRRALGRAHLEAENLRLKTALQGQYHFGNLVGSSPAMAEVYDLIRRVKDTRISVLINGESGTGKELVARAIHYSGLRKSGPMMAINCGAIPENLVESELFGHKRGSFTGAVRDKEGLFAAAHGGTLFLDEVSELPLPAQVKLLRALQERRITPVGSVEEQEVDVRIIAATNTDLETALEEGSFREDLYYRLNIVQIPLPPLRERGEDIMELARHFTRMHAEEYGKSISGIDPDAAERVRSWHFPGNVRELNNIIERAVALCAGSVLGVADLPGKLRGDRGGEGLDEKLGLPFPPDGIDLEGRLAAVEKGWLLAALRETAGNRTRAAELLGMSFRSFRYRLAKYDLDRGDG